jgi:hypothetical protein
MEGAARHAAVDARCGLDEARAVFGWLGAQCGVPLGPPQLRGAKLMCYVGARHAMCNTLSVTT